MERFIAIRPAVTMLLLDITLSMLIQLALAILLLEFMHFVAI